MYQVKKHKPNHHSFFCMNTEYEISVPSAYHPLAEKRLKQIEKYFSRFQPDSELSYFNQLEVNIPFLPSNWFYQVLFIARNIEKMSDGLITPRILDSLKEWGYSKSFEKLERDPSIHASPKPRPILKEEMWVDFDHHMKSVKRLSNTTIDLGGFVKGWGVDTTVQELRNKRINEGMINAGGDLKVWGKKSWMIEIVDPFDPKKSSCCLEVKNMSVATSGINKRSWGNGLHHIIDPRTGIPVNSDVVQATVVADSVLKAEVLSKIWIILGVNQGRKWMEKKNISYAYVLVLRNGKRITYKEMGDAGWKAIS